MTEVRALLLTDVVDSTQLSESLGDAVMATVWTAHDRVARELLPPHRGREIDKTDGMLLMFEQADDAIAYAGAYHRALAGLTPPLKARAGLHVGPVILRENAAEDVARGAKPLEVDGMAKPTAARIMGLARGGQTLVSPEALQALSAGRGQTQQAQRVPHAHSHGHWRVKGVAEPIELFEVGEPPFVTPPDADKAYRVVRVGERWLPVRQVPNNLPQQGTSFLGRERELDELKAALRSARLVTLLGMGGLGKTRLSLQVAAELLGEFPDGAWFLDLSPLREPSLVVEEAARLLQVKEEPGRPLLQTLCAQLRERRLLLVIDNCEHLVEASAALAHALLRAAPEVRMMASSRIALRVPGEQTYPVLPLPLPGSGDDAAALARSTAVRLFVARAQTHKPAFALDDQSAPHVAALVARLEGIPLALELAAARVRSLSVADINLRLKDRFKLLTSGARVHQERQQTLRSLVDWSYDLLRPPEQTLLQRLGVFGGGFDLAAAEAVCGTEPLDPMDMVDLLDTLVENSLVTLDESAHGTRYRMLETLREYAFDKLVQAGDSAAAGARHCEHFFGVAKQARDGLRGPQQAEWVARAEADLDNLRGAMATARAGTADPLLAAKLPVALQGFWILRGRLGEGRELVRAALALPAVQASDVARAHTLYVGAVLATSQGDALEANELLETCLAIRRGLQDEAGMAMTLSALAMARLAIGKAESALAAELEALQLFRRQAHRVGEAVGLQHLGHIEIHLGRLDDARGHTQQGLELARNISNLEIECECEWLLGEIAMAGDDLATAREHAQRALQHSREAGDRSDEAKALGAMGRIALRCGELESSRRYLGEALRAFRDFEMRAELSGGLEDHADLALALGLDDTAARLLGAATESRTRLHLARAQHEVRRDESRSRDLRLRMDEAAFTAALAAGTRLGLADAIEAALALPQAPG